MHYRIESDSIGSRQIPQDANYGVQSLHGIRTGESVRNVLMEKKLFSEDEVEQLLGLKTTV